MQSVCESCQNEAEAIATGYYETNSGWGFGTYRCETKDCRYYRSQVLSESERVDEARAAVRGSSVASDIPTSEGK